MCVCACASCACDLIFYCKFSINFECIYHTDDVKSDMKYSIMLICSWPDHACWHYCTTVHHWGLFIRNIYCTVEFLSNLQIYAFDLCILSNFVTDKVIERNKSVKECSRKMMRFSISNFQEQQIQNAFLENLCCV